MRLFWIQTRLGFRRTRSIPLTDRGFRYGMAVFETLRTDRGRVRFLQWHLESLHRACVISGLPVPNFEKLPPAPDATGVLRIHVTAGDGGPADPVERSRVFLTFESRTGHLPDSSCLQTQPSPHRPSQAGLKTHNYWPQSAALLAARNVGADESLLFNADGHLISAAMANVFIVDEDGALLTPPLELEARDGILRRWVCDRQDVSPALITREEVQRATEVFLTNSWVGVMPGARLDGRDLPSMKVAAGLRSDLQAEYDRTDQ